MLSSVYAGSADELYDDDDTNVTFVIATFPWLFKNVTFPKIFNLCPYSAYPIEINDKTTANNIDTPIFIITVSLSFFLLLLSYLLCFIGLTIWI